MNTREALAALAPYVNRHNVGSFRRLPPYTREAFARWLARDAKAPGEWRLMFNLLLAA